MHEAYLSRVFVALTRSVAQVSCLMAWLALGGIAEAAWVEPLAAAPRDVSIVAQVRAAESTARPLAQSLRGEALEAYKRARLLFSEKDFPGALAMFQISMEKSRDPRLLWNMAACEVEQRHYTKALGYMKRYLREAIAFIPPEEEHDVKET